MNFKEILYFSGLQKEVRIKFSGTKQKELYIENAFVSNNRSVNYLLRSQKN